MTRIGNVGRARIGPSLLALGGLLAAGQPSCATTFEGPYPCVSGFASCTTSNACETSVASDGTNCGACGHTCAPGAACSNGTCGAAPTVLASVSTPAGIAANGTAVVWSSIAGIQAASPAGGSVTTLLSGSPTAFALDATNVYVAPNGPDGTLQSAGIYALPIAGGSAIELAPQPSSQGSSQGGATAWVGVNGADVFLSTQSNGGSGFTFWSVPVSGGTATTLGTSPRGASPIVLGPSAIYFTACNGPCSVLSLPLTGGSPVTFSNDDATTFAVDSQNLYAVSTSNCCGCTGNGQEASTTVRMYPLNGAASSVLATTTATIDAPLGVAVDDTDVYWVTPRSVWKVPLGGGAAVSIAGNLGGTASSCNNGSNGGGNGGGDTSFIALDATHVYVADGFTGAIYEIAK